jgi:hypothetical protein
MPNCDFYAVGDDHRAILEFLIEDGSCRIFEMYSPFGQRVKEFHNLTDFRARYDFRDWHLGCNESILLQLYAHDSSAKVAFERIELDPKRCQGATFRYKTVGWGLVQLYLEPVRRNKLHSSHTNHNSEKRARAWEETSPELGPVARWNWKSVTSFSRRLNSFIRKLAVFKIGSRVVLPQADALRNQGVIFDIN